MVRRRAAAVTEDTARRRTDLKTVNPALIFAVTATGVAANVLPAAVLPEILAAVGSPPSAAGIFLGAGTLPGILIAPLIGLGADRWGRRALLVPCLTLVSVSGVLHAATGSLPVLLALRLAQGVGSAGLINLAVVLIADHWKGDDRVRMLGRNAAFLTVSLATLPFIGGAVTEAADWRAMFLLFGLSGALALWAWRELSGEAQGLDRQRALRDQAKAMLELLTSRSVLSAMLGTMTTLALLFGAVLTIVPVIGVLEYGLDPSSRGLLMGLPTVGTLGAALQLRRGVVAFGQAKVLVVAAGSLAVALIALALSGTVAAVGIALVLYGFGHGWAVPSFQNVVAGEARTGRIATALSLQAGFTRLGQTIGPVVGAGAYGAWGGGGSFGIFALLAGLLVPLGLLATRGSSARIPVRDPSVRESDC